MTENAYRPEDVLDFWFPDDGHWNSIETHMAFWEFRMQGGVDEEICNRFAGLTEAAAKCELDHWAETPRGRLALLIALDQFPRSLWRDTPGAYAQDIKATRVALEGIENGHYHALTVPWERQFYIIALGHCEGPDHLARFDLMEKLDADQVEIAPPALKDLMKIGSEQTAIVRGIIERFGRHPHRNAILGRVSSDEEAAYIEKGEFPHERKLPDSEDALEEERRSG